jgi:hypothetical protein
MPQSWVKNWPLPPEGSESERDARIHRLGNLTLLTKKLNSTVSNGPWLGERGKAAHLQEKDVLLLNSKVLKDFSSRQWNEAGIDQRGKKVIDALLEIWPVPSDHKVNIAREHADSSVTVEIVDLIGAGYLAAGQTLYSRPGKYGGHTSRLLSDGRIDVAGEICDSPSQAGKSVRKKTTNGWNFWRLEPNGGRPLAEVREEYLRVISPGEAEQEDSDSVDAD